MDHQYISVAEFAKRAAVTPAYIYKLLKSDSTELTNRLQPFQQVVDGKKLIHINALSLFENKQDEQQFNNYSTEFINSLKAQIEALNEQIKIKDTQISDLSEMNRNTQILLLNQQQLLLPLNAEPAADPMEEPKPAPEQKKKSFWDKLFNK